MDAKIIRRALIIITVIIVVLGLSFACNALTGDDSTPTVSNPDEVFLSFDGIEVTNQDLYKKMTTMDGLMHLLNFVDQDLLSDYINDVTQDDIDEEMKRLKYGTINQDEIDQMTEDELIEREQNYRDTVLVAGFDPEDEDAVENFVKLNLAKFNYALETMDSADEDSDYYISSGDVLVYYEDNHLGDLQAIQLRFNSTTEYNNVLKHFNLVPNFEGGIGLYEGDDPIEDIASDDFTEDNTRVLDDEETLEYYIKMYNYLYQHRDALNESASAEALAGLGSDHLSFNYLDMISTGESRLKTQADYVFKDLFEADNDYSIQSKSIGDYRFLYYVLERTPDEVFSSLSSDERADIRIEYIESLINDEMILEIMGEMREENGFKIHDQQIASQYARENGIEAYESKKGSDAIATLNDTTLTTDDYFDYMSNKVGALYSVEVAKEHYLKASAYFEDTYGSNRDVWKNSSDIMKEHRQHVRSDKAAFSNGVYQMYGFSPQNMTWEDFLYLGYGLADETDYLNTLVTQRLRNFYINDALSFDDIAPYIEEQFDNYFSLDVEHILIYVDLEENFQPDDFNEYLDSLDAMDQSSFDTLKAELEDVILDALEDQTMKEVITEYNQALRGENEDDSDYSKWAKFKNAGLLLKHENLSEDESLNYNNSQGLVDEFKEALVAIYADYNTAENSDEDFIYANELTTTQFGIHMIRAEQGDDFEKPETMPTAAMANDYHLMQLAEMYEDIEDESNLSDEDIEALEAYYATVYDNVFSNSNFTILMIDTMRDTSYSFAQNSAHHTNMLDTIYELFERRTFPPID